MSDQKPSPINLANIQLYRNYTEPITSPTDTLRLTDLNIDCLEEIFEFLSIIDLKSLRRTCRRLKQAITYHVAVNYPSNKFGYRKLEISSSLSKPNDFEMVKELNIFNSRICVPLNNIESVLNELEIMTIWLGAGVDCENNRNHCYCNPFLWPCNNLKYLKVCDLSETTEWAFGKHPKLQHFEYSQIFYKEMAELGTFFKQNVGIKIFTTTSMFLVLNENWLKELGIKLDVLQIQIYSDSFNDSFGKLLELLYKRGFYQQLNLNVDSITTNDEIYRISSCCDIKRLRVLDSYNGILEELLKIKEVSIPDASIFNVDMSEDMIMGSALERIDCRKGCLDDIISIVRYLPKLRHLRVDYLKEHDGDGIIEKMAWLNEERSRLLNARKMTIYLPEIIFLAAKRALVMLDCRFIQFKRNQTINKL